MEVVLTHSLEFSVSALETILSFFVNVVSNLDYLHLSFVDFASVIVSLCSNFLRFHEAFSTS